MIDYSTVLYSTMATTLIASIGMFYTWAQYHKRFGGIGYWLVGAILQTVSIILFSQRGILAGWFISFVGTVAIVLSSFLLYRGLVRFFGEPSALRINYVLLLIYLLLVAFFTFVQNVIEVRTLLNSLGTLLFNAQCAGLILLRAGSRVRSMARLLAYFCLAFCLVSIVRIVMLVISTLLPDAASSAILPQSTGFILIFQFLVIGQIFSLLSLVTNRIQFEVRQHEAERQRQTDILQARLTLLQYAIDHPVEQLLQATIDEAERLTGSQIGFHHFFDADQNAVLLQTWSTKTKATYCKAEGVGLHYSIDKAGVWIDCVLERRPVIHNDYASLAHRKGLPDGHAPVIRELVVPIIRDGRVVAILGVGNKPVDYDEEDVRTVSLLADLSWDISERKLIEERYQSIFEKHGAAMLLVDPQSGAIIEANGVARKYIGFPQDLPGGLTLADMNVFPPDQLIDLLQKAEREDINNFRVPYRLPSGNVRTIELFCSPVLLASRRFVFAIINDVTERIQAEEQIKQSLAEKELLIRELYHRTRNNMTLIMALLDLQSFRINDERLERAFIDTGNRIHSMALVHEKLYEANDLSRINLKDYVVSLVDDLRITLDTQPEPLCVDFRMEDVFVLIDTAIPCGLILNEMISNAFQHAYPDGRSGTVTIRLKRLPDGEIMLGVQDDGVGFPEGFNPRRDGQMGLSMMFSLVEFQLKAHIKIASGPGVSYEVTFRDNHYSPRV